MALFDAEGRIFHTLISRTRPHPLDPSSGQSFALKHAIPPEYQAHMESRNALLQQGSRDGISARAFWTGGFLSLFLAVGAPYVRMAMRATPLAFDFTTVGALFLLLVVTGGTNAICKLTVRRPPLAVCLAVALPGAVLIYYATQDSMNPSSPAFLLNVFASVSAVMNLFMVRRGRSLAPPRPASFSVRSRQGRLGGS